MYVTMMAAKGKRQGWDVAVDEVERSGMWPKFRVILSRGPFKQDDVNERILPTSVSRTIPIKECIQQGMLEVGFRIDEWMLLLAVLLG